MYKDEPSTTPPLIYGTPERKKVDNFHSGGFRDTPDTSASSYTSPTPPASPSASNSTRKDIVKEKSKALIKTAQAAINDTTTAMTIQRSYKRMIRIRKVRSAFDYNVLCLLIEFYFSRTTLF